MERPPRLNELPVISTQLPSSSQRQLRNSGTLTSPLTIISADDQGFAVSRSLIKAIPTLAATLDYGDITEVKIDNIVGVPEITGELMWLILQFVDYHMVQPYVTLGLTKGVVHDPLTGYDQEFCRLLTLEKALSLLVIADYLGLATEGQNMVDMLQRCLATKFTAGGYNVDSWLLQFQPRNLWPKHNIQVASLQLPLVDLLRGFDLYRNIFDVEFFRLRALTINHTNLPLIPNITVPYTSEFVELARDIDSANKMKAYLNRLLQDYKVQYKDDPLLAASLRPGSSSVFTPHLLRPYLLFTALQGEIFVIPHKFPHMYNGIDVHSFIYYYFTLGRAAYINDRSWLTVDVSKNPETIVIPSPVIYFVLTGSSPDFVKKLGQTDKSFSDIITPEEINWTNVDESFFILSFKGFNVSFTWGYLGRPISEVKSDRYFPYFYGRMRALMLDPSLTFLQANLKIIDEIGESVNRDSNFEFYRILYDNLQDEGCIASFLRDMAKPETDLQEEINETVVRALKVIQPRTVEYLISLISNRETTVIPIPDIIKIEYRYITKYLVQRSRDMLKLLAQYPLLLPVPESYRDCLKILCGEHVDLATLTDYPEEIKHQLYYIMDYVAHPQLTTDIIRTSFHVLDPSNREQCLVLYDLVNWFKVANIPEILNSMNHYIMDKIIFLYIYGLAAELYDTKWYQIIIFHLEPIDEDKFREIQQQEDLEDEFDYDN